MGTTGVGAAAEPSGARRRRSALSEQQRDLARSELERPNLVARCGCGDLGEVHLADRAVVPVGATEARSPR